MTDRWIEGRSHVPMISSGLVLINSLQTSKNRFTCASFGVSPWLEATMALSNRLLPKRIPITLDIGSSRNGFASGWIPPHFYKIAPYWLNQLRYQDFSKRTYCCSSQPSSGRLTWSRLTASINILHVQRCATGIFSLNRSSNGVLKATNLSEVLSRFSENNQRRASLSFYRRWLSIFSDNPAIAMAMPLDRMFVGSMMTKQHLHTLH